ncbi:MAG: choice-of-anchor J domain-containing protein [Methanobacteriota archaeon]
MEMNAKFGQLLSLVFAVAMVATVFTGLSGFGNDGAKQVPLQAKGLPSAVQLGDRAFDTARLVDGRMKLNQLPPVERPESVVFNEGFETGIVGNVPDDPPWVVTEVASTTYGNWGPDDFENDTVGQNPDTPYWTTVDGTSAPTYWGRNMEDTVVSQDLSTGYMAGDAGDFTNLGGDATTLAVTPPAGAPAGTIITGLTTGTMCAQFNEGVDEPAQSTFGPAGIDSSGTVTSAYAGCWVRLTSTTQRADFWLYDYNLGGGNNPAMQFIFFGGSLYHYPGGTQTVLTTYAANTWYEFYVQYNEVGQTYSVWWNGAQLAAGSAWNDPTEADINSMFWFGGEATAQPPSNIYVDNWFHFTPATGGAHVVDVVDTWSYGGGGAQSVYIDQNNYATAPASTTALFPPPYAWGAFAGVSWGVKTSTTIANTNGATFEILDFNGRILMALRFSGGQIQYLTGVTWTNLGVAFAADTEYWIDAYMDATNKCYMGIDIDYANYVGSGPALANEGAGIAGFRARGTTGTQSEVFMDDVSAWGDVQDGTVRISDAVAHTGTQSVRLWEANSDTACDMGAYLGGDFVTYGNFGFWFYAEQTVGAGSVYLLDTTQTYLVTIISLGTDLSVANIPEPGQVKFVDGDGSAGGTIIDGPTITPGTWNHINVSYDAIANTCEIFWNGASQGTFGFLENAADDAGIVFFFGEGPVAPQDFYYDDIGLWVDDLPTTPENLRVYAPPPLTQTTNYYTVDQDNAVEGTVTPLANGYQNVDELGAPDAATENILEATIPGGTQVAQYTYTGVTQAAGPHNAFASDVDAMPPTGANLNTKVRATDANFGQITTSEDTRWIVAAAGNGDETFMWSDVVVSQSPASVTRIFLSCELQSAAATNFQLYALDQSTTTWTTIGGTVAGAANTDVVVGAAITVNPSNYMLNGTLSWGCYQVTGNQILRTDRMNVTVTYTTPTTYSLEHRWRTQNVPAGAEILTLEVTGRTSATPDDSFTFGYSAVLAGPYSPLLTVNGETMATYQAGIPLLSGVFYINVVDSSGTDSAADTLYVDRVRIKWQDITGAVFQNELTSADNAVVGTVAGVHGLTQTLDGSAQQITEVATAGTVTFVDEGFEGGWLPAGWSTIDADGDGYNWMQITDSAVQPVHSGTRGAYSESYVNGVGALTPDNYLITQQIDLTGGYTTATATWWDAAQDAAWPSERYQVRVSTTTPTAGAFTNLIADYTLTGIAYTQRTASLTPYIGQMIYVAWEHCLCTDWYQLKIDDILITAQQSGYNAEHRWTMQNMPANTLSNTVYATARTSAGADDTFSIGWSQTLAGPYTTLITINSASYATYMASMPTTFSGALYLRVKADTGGDAVPDTVFIDNLYVRSLISPVNTTINVQWDLSADDGAGANDVTYYNVYYSDEFTGGDSAGPFDYLASVPAGTDIYRHYGEADDMVFNIWYIVTAVDAHSEGFSTGRASKFNEAPLASNVLVDGVTAVEIPQGTASVALTASVFDDSSTWEDILKMDGAEWYDTTDPGAGLGTPMNGDGAFDNIDEAFTYAIPTAAWPGGTNHQIFVRGHEAAPGNTGNGWSAAVSVWINVTAGAASPWQNITVDHIGWNLVSVNISGPTSMPGALTDLANGGAGLVQWTRAMWYDPNGGADVWKQYYTVWNPALNDLTAVDVTMGIWLFVTVVGDGQICIGGAAYTTPVLTNITLKAGWNLVGFPSDDLGYTVAMFKADVSGTTVQTVEQYDGGQTYLTSAMNDASLMAPDNAYWVKVTSDGVWTKSY